MANHPRGRSPAGEHQVLRARVILPIASPPIENGAVLVFRDRFALIGAWDDFARKLAPSMAANVVDLGDVVLLPGLVNAHCHLDYTHMAGFWPPPKKFLDWIPGMLAAKAEWSYSDYARSWLAGAKMLLESGVTTVADIEAVPELLPDVWDATPLRVLSFLELTSVRSKREPAEIVAEAMGKIESLAHLRCVAALSPHAPYSTSPELLRLCADAMRQKKIRVAVHVAESEQEFEMFARARGEMFDWLKRNGRDNSDCGLGSPVQHLERAGLATGTCLAVHANYLDETDFGLLSRRGVSVVHCPRSHEYFRHQKFPLDQLLSAGINVCLGTDSLATIARNADDKLELNLFQELQHLACSNPGLSPETMLMMATVNGAKALGMAGKIGELSGHAFADLITLPFAGKLQDAEDAVVNFSGPVRASMIGGRWTIPPESN